MVPSKQIQHQPGITLFAVEMGWFVVLPIWKELKVWWTHRGKWQSNKAARRSDVASFTAVVTDIDNMATLNLPKPMLASPYGGPIAAHAGQKGEMTAHESLYRVTLKTDGTANERQLVPVSARIDSERSSYLLDSIRKAAGGVIRESGL